MPLVYTQPDGEITLEQNNLLKTIKLGKQWEVSFQLKPTSYEFDSWTSILHMTIGEDNVNPGDRTPAIFYHPSHGLHVTRTSGSDPDSYKEIKPAPPVGEWSTIVLSQLQTGSTTTFSVKIEGATLWTIENPAPLEFPSVKVFASNPWHPAQAGSIRGLVIKTL